MAPYVLLYNDDGGHQMARRAASDTNKLYFVTNNNVAVLQSHIHLKDLSLYGTRLSTADTCRDALNRLRYANYACQHESRLMKAVLANLPRTCEADLFRIECTGCINAYMKYCVLLMENTAVEASREHDWILHNEAVVQLCWALYHIRINTTSGDALAQGASQGSDMLRTASSKLKQPSDKSSAVSGIQECDDTVLSYVDWHIAL